MTPKKYDLLTSGYVSMDHMLKIKTPAAVGFTSLIANKTNTRIYYGGCSVNVAYALCRLGLCAMPILRVGDDYEQIGFKAFLEQGNVPTQAVRTVPGEITSVCYLVQDNEGQHITLFYPGSMDGQYATPLEDAFFEQAAMGLLTVGARQDNEIFFNQCKKHSLPLAFGMKGDLDAFPPELLRELLYYCRIIFTNESERQTIEEMLGEPMEALLEKGNAQVLVTTLGKAGSTYQAKTAGGVETGTVPICDCGPPVDTTGSGDGYISGFLYGWGQGRPVRECAMLGTVLSSFIIEQEGCCTAAPKAEDLLARYEAFKTKLGGD